MAGILGTNVVTQVAFVVKDIEATKKRFAEFLGVEPPATISGGDETTTDVTYRGKPAPKAGAKLAFFNVGPQLTIELIEPNGEPSAWQEGLDQNGEGFHHIAFVVEGTDEKVKACEAFGMEMVMQGLPKKGTGQYTYLDATKDLKCYIELLEGY